MADNQEPQEPQEPEKTLQEELKEWRQALQEEYETGDKAVEIATAEVKIKAREMMNKGVPTGILGILYLAEHAESESVKLSASKYLADYGLGKNGAFEGDDTFNDFLSRIVKEKPKDTVE